MSWTLEFQGYGPQPSHYTISSGAAVSCVGADPGAKTIYNVFQEMLEDELVGAQYSEKDRVVTLKFRSGAQLEFSNSNFEGGDNAAIITNVANGEWTLLV